MQPSPRRCVHLWSSICAEDHGGKNRWLEICFRIVQAQRRETSTVTHLLVLCTKPSDILLDSPTPWVISYNLIPNESTLLSMHISWYMLLGGRTMFHVSSLKSVRWLVFGSFWLVVGSFWLLLTIFIQSDIISLTFPLFFLYLSEHIFGLS